MIEKNKTYTIEITGIGEKGEGIGRYDDFVIFVPYALPGEVIRVLILKVLKNFAYGKIVDIVTPSVHRIKPSCPSFNQCGGCDFQHCDYGLGLEIKTRRVRDCITRIGGININVEDTVGCNESNYRNKSQFPVTPDGIGFYAQRSHRVIPINDCKIQDKRSNKVVDIVKSYMDMFNISPYDEVHNKGMIRHIYTRCSQSCQMMICIVTAARDLKSSDSLVSMLIKEFGDSITIIQNINKKNTNVILGEENILLYGTGMITDKIGDLYFEISPHSFFQINPYQTKNLYDKVLELCDFKGNETVLDLFCGIGTIGLYASKYVKSVIGVECVPQAIENARKNALLNNIKNAEFYVGNAEDIAHRFENIDVVIIDPPRKGCEQKLIKTISNMSPKKIVYVSCNPATLARDIKEFSCFGYIADTVYPYDMFPRTSHVECVVLLSKVDK